MMNASPPSTLQFQGLDALKRNDYAGARDAFLAARDAGQVDAMTHLGLAYAHAGLLDRPAASAAADEALLADPRNLRALLLKGELTMATGDEQGAAAFWRAALQVAPAERSGLAAELQQALHDAELASDRAATRFEEALRGHVASAMPVGVKPSPRFVESLDLLTGRKQRYVQQPQLYLLPGLPQIQFYERAQFPWLDAVEAATPAIREELLAVLKEDASFTPYLERDPSRPALNDPGLVGQTDWSAFYLWKNGRRVEANAARCPRTMAALENVPLSQLPGRAPSILFSQLKPGARIPPHTGFINTRLIVHLPLIVSPGCSFRVGNDTRQWQEGQAWVFDDTMEHEAWNTSDQTRVVLLFEIWRPELTMAERMMVQALFGALDRQGATPADWGI
jgi:aspartyl/asparaginyl beta-hydroxylase (cupin superfamily)